MNKRFQAIINRVYRFRVQLSSWSALRGLFLQGRFVVGFAAELRKHIKIALHKGFRVGCDFILNAKRKMLADINIGIDFFTALRSRFKLNHHGEFEIGFESYFHKRGSFKVKRFLSIEFISRFIRKRPLKTKSGVKVGFKSRPKRKARLYFNGLRMTIYTVTLMKILTIKILKNKSIKTMKQEWRTLPEFRITFLANLKIR